MTREDLSAWALANGWRMLAGSLCLTKPSRPNEAIVRLVFKTTVVNVEVKKPAGKWEKLAGAAYNAVQADEDGGLPAGLGFEAIPGISMLMRENRDQVVFAAMGGGQVRK